LTSCRRQFYCQPPEIPKSQFSIILTTAGQETVSGAPGLLWDAGLFLLVGGAIGIALHLTRHRPLIIRIVTSLLAPVVFFLSFLTLDFLVKSVIPSRWPSYVRDEASILVVAVICLVMSLIVLASGRRIVRSD